MRLDIAKLKFLVVDDNLHMRHIVRGLLLGLGGRTVYEAEDGAGGLEALRTRAPDILIVDCPMPVLDGIELVRMIRRPHFRFNPLIPVIMLTGYPERQRVLQALEAGVDEILCKPISAKALHDRILSVVQHRRAFVQSKDYLGPDRPVRTDSGNSGEIEAYLADRRQAERVRGATPA